MNEKQWTEIKPAAARIRTRKHLAQSGLKQEINRIAHLKMQQTFAVLRMQMEDRACELLEAGKSRSEVMQELMHEFNR
jgi:hypothetical protein